MKNILLALLFVLGFSVSSFAQQNVVTWTSNVEKVGENEYKINLHAEMEDGWYIYSQFLEPGGPLPTEIKIEDINFKPNQYFKEDSNFATESFDDVFQIKIKKYSHSVDFYQIVKNSTPPSGEALITFMSCNEDRCNPPREVEVQF